MLFFSGDIIMTGEGHKDWLSDCDFHPGYGGNVLNIKFYDVMYMEDSFFQASLFQLLKLEINCDDHLSLLNLMFTHRASHTTANSPQRHYKKKTYVQMACPEHVYMYVLCVL